jgi:hypothetical protein
MYKEPVVSRISLTFYRDATAVSEFCSYLQARGVSHRVIIKHLSLASKVNTHLCTTRFTSRADIPFNEAITRWLATMGTQLTNQLALLSRNLPVRENRPSLELMIAVSRKASRLALLHLGQEVAAHGGLRTKETAMEIQDAIVLGLLSGEAAPPLRASAIRTARHPRCARIC